MTAVELAVQDARGARIAAAVGAERVELCSALSLGGLTPSHGAIDAARVALADSGTGLHVLVRPRTGGFVYDADEADVCVADVEAAVDAGADGVVVGCLTADGAVDRWLLRRLRAAAGAATVTFHRAIDVAAEPLSALPILIDAGVHRVLSSGGAPSAIEGSDLLARFVEIADGRMEIMAGAGVTSRSVSPLLRLGVTAVHASAKRAEPMSHGLALGSADEAHLWRTDPTEAKALVEAVRTHDGITR